MIWNKICSSVKVALKPVCLFLQKLLVFLLLETRDQEVVGGYLDIRIDRCLDISYRLLRLA